MHSALRYLLFVEKFPSQFPCSRSFATSASTYSKVDELKKAWEEVKKEQEIGKNDQAEPKPNYAREFIIVGLLLFGVQQYSKSSGMKKMIKQMQEEKQVIDVTIWELEGEIAALKRKLEASEESSQT